MSIREAAVAVASRSCQRIPLTLWFGLLIIITCEALLFTDVRLSRRGPVHAQAQIESLESASPPVTLLARMARYVAFNMTPLAWLGYLFFIEGVLTLQRGGSPVRRRRHHFALLFLASVFIWCIFDWVNFYSIRAWRYIGMPPTTTGRVPGYIIAFGAIVPGMLMSGQVLLNLRIFNWARTRAWRMPAWVPVLSFVVGLAMFVWPLVHHDPITNLTLWTSLVFLLDPINLLLGRPSMLRDWRDGWFGRTLAAFAGGLACGFLWEFWNYWALSKWVYSLPFLGAAEHIRYFEMPVLGLLGFLPFGIECWIIWQTMRIPLDGLVEPLPGESDLL
jgi:hypothetical protein